jgi:hypothetical protein
MREITVNQITFQVSDPDVLPHKAIAIHAEDELERVRIPEFVEVDDMPYPVLEIEEHFLGADSLAKQVDIPCTCKVIKQDAFVEVNHVIVFMVDMVKDPEGFEQGWSHNSIVKHNEPSGLAKFMTPVDVTNGALSRNPRPDKSEKKENKNIFSAEGLRNRAQHWNTKTVVIVSVVVLVLFIGICVGVGFALKK